MKQRAMNFLCSEYITPLVEEVPIASVGLFAASNLENPEKGNEWSWD